MSDSLPSARGIVAATDLGQLLQIRVDALSLNTRDAYAKDWAMLAQRLEAESLPQLINALMAQGKGPANLLLLAWRSDMLTAGLSPATINRRLAAACTLLRWAYQADLIDWMASVPRVPTEKYRDTTGPPQAAVEAMINAATTRDKAILLCAYTLRLRRAEVCRLDLEHFTEDTLSVQRKGRHELEPLTVPPETLTAINDYLETRPEGDGPLFLTKTGRRLRGGEIYRIVRKWAARAGLKGDVSPHRLLHSGVNAALEATNGNIAAVSAWAGHKDTATTMKYWDNIQGAQAEVAKKVAGGLTLDNEG